MFIINSQSSISLANVINNWLDYMKSVTIFNFDKINLFADISFRFPYSSDMFLQAKPNNESFSLEKHVRFVSAFK